MKHVPTYLLAALCCFTTVSCKHQSFKKTKSGLLYKLISDGKGEPVKKGEFLKINVLDKVRDSVLFTSYNSMPAYARVDSGRADYNPGEVFSLLRDGDSVVVVQTEDSLRRKYGQLPAFIHKGDKVIITFKVLKVFTTEQAATEDRRAEIEKQKQREIKQVQDYLAANKINPTQTDKGTFVVVQTPGDGPLIDSGKEVSIRYTGRILPTNEVFQTNTSPTGQPFKFVVGQRRAIEGMDDGIRLFRKGGKGTLYIPAYLAYDQAQRPGKTSYENLSFEIEVVDVTDAPKESAQPPSMSMPHMPMRPPQQPMQQQQRR